MEEPQSRFLKRWLMILAPILGVFSLGFILLDKQAIEPPAPQPTAASSPVTVQPTAATTASTASQRQPPVQASQVQVKPSTVAIHPDTFTDQQKAINRRSKAAFLTGAPTVDSLIEMKIAISEGVPELELDVSAGATVMDEKNQPLLKLSAGRTYFVQADGQDIRLGDRVLKAPIWVLPEPNGLISVGDRNYRGYFLLVANQGALWAINHVNLRQYLYSVVASEVSPSWPAEALKAQAVAARSYALTYYFKPVNPLFQMGATEYYQVYSGTEKEDARTNQAVDATAGEYVSHRGGIVESLYAASDDIVAEAFQGQGMSQLGALNLAEQGYAYRDILNNYYPGTSLGKIPADTD